MVRNAEIDLKGLVVIAGENDTGKSTIGKLLFSIIRAFTKYREEFEYDRHEYLLNHAQMIYFDVRSQIDLDAYAQIREAFGNPFLERLDELLQSDQIDEIQSVLKSKIEFIQQLNIDKEVKDLVTKKLNEMLRLSLLNNDDPEVKRQALNKVLASEFDQQIINPFLGNEASVTGKDGSNRIFSITIKDDEINQLEYLDDIFYNEAIYIESPYVLQMSDFLSTRRYTGGLFVRRVPRYYARYPLHVADLLKQLHIKFNPEYSIAHAISDEAKVTENLYEQIAKIIGGTLSYKKSEREIVYKKIHGDETIDLKLSNIATGIKSFGIIQMMLKAGILHNRSLLIIDEPEVHLYPKWQIEYAKLLVLIAKKLNTNILLTSHSPYFIEAIKVYSDKFDFANKTRFYLAKKDDENMFCSDILNVTENLELIFKKLLEPFKRLEEESVGDPEW